MQFCLHEAGFGGFECRSHRSSSLRLFAVSRERQSRSNTDEHVSRSSDGSSKTNKIRAEHLPRRSTYEQSKQQSHHRDNSSGEANVDGNGAARGKNLRTRHIPHLMSDGSDSQSHGSDRPHHSLDRFLAGLSQSRKGTSAQTLQPADLFPKSNISRLPPLLILYFPFGVIIAGLRMAIWLVLLLVDQPWLTDNNLSIAILQTVLGVDVRWYNAQNIPKARHVLVSNHVTTGDMMMLYKLPRKTVHLISSTVPQRVTQVKNHRIQFRHASVASYDSLAKDKVSHSIHLFPEGGMTNGNGMMKFNRGFMRFSEGLCVVPVALQATLPWDIRTHTLTSSFLSNMFWFCFSPFVRLELTVLPPLRQNQRLGESKAAFVERIQQKIALELDIPILDFTLQAKKQMIKSAGRKVHH